MKLNTFKQSTNFIHIFKNASDILCYDCDAFLRSCFVLHKCKANINIKIEKCVCTHNIKCKWCQNLNRCVEFWYPPPQYII